MTTWYSRDWHSAGSVARVVMRIRHVEVVRGQEGQDPTRITGMESLTKVQQGPNVRRLRQSLRGQKTLKVSREQRVCQIGTG